MKKRVFSIVLAIAMVLGCVFTSSATPAMDEFIGEGELTISDDALTNYNPVYLYEGDEEASIEPYAASNLKLELSITDYLVDGLPRNQLITTKNKTGSIRLRDFDGDSVRIRLTNLEYESTGYIRGGLATYNSANGTFDATAYIVMEIGPDTTAETVYDTFPIEGTNLELKKGAQMYGFIKNLTGGDLSYGELRIYDFNI